jgi:hypothetical protein
MDVTVLKRDVVPLGNQNVKMHPEANNTNRECRIEVFSIVVQYS